MPISLQLPTGGRCFQPRHAQICHHHRCCRAIPRAAAVEASAPTAQAEPEGPLEPSQFKRDIAEEFTQRAPEYDQSDAYHHSLAESLVSLADIQPGQTVLDVATGTGLVAVVAAHAVGPTGRVFGIDMTHAMLCEAVAKGDSKQLLNISWIWEDAETAEFPLGTFDHVLCSSGIAYLEDPEAAFQRFNSWLKPGGKLTFNSPQDPMLAPARYLTELVQDVFGAQLAEPIFPADEPATLRLLCEASSFSSIEIGQMEEVLLFEGYKAGDYAELAWQQLTGDAQYMPMAGDKMAELKHVKQEFLQTVAKEMQPSVQDDGMHIPMVALQCSALKLTDEDRAQANMVQQAEFENVGAAEQGQDQEQDQEQEQETVEQEAVEPVQAEPAPAAPAKAKPAARKSRAKAAPKA